MDWKKRGSATSVEEVIHQNSGMTDDELLYPKYANPEGIKNLREVADIILDTIQCKYPIVILGDYDVDGITASSILFRLFGHFKIPVTCRLPKRFSEGYSLSNTAIDEITDPNTLIVTVDNGIAAAKQVTYARSKGYSVIIIDHHLPDAELPDADVLVDPHINPSKNVYENYCGAGLALKLSEMMLNDEFVWNHGANKEQINMILSQMTILAAIGTIADVMPLNGDNRRIVKYGLELLQKYDVCGLTGIKAIIECSELYSRTEHDIGFEIAPMLNAPGRLYDDGAMQSFKIVMADIFTPDYQEVKNAAMELILVNENRKDAVSLAMEEALDYIADECLYGSCPLCVCLEEANEGVVGIVAGRLAEQMKVPAFVFTSTDEHGILKGSGRSFGGINLKAMVDAASEYTLQAGGHEGAAGVTVKADSFFDMVRAMTEYAVRFVTENSNVQYYDLELNPDKVADVCAQLQKYAPFGEGNPSPIFRVNNIGLVPRMGNRYKAMGKDGVHLKLYSNGYTVLCFNGTEAYRRSGLPTRIDAIGTISENQFRNIKEVQFEATEIKSATTGKISSKLLGALKANGTI